MKNLLLLLCTILFGFKMLHAQNQQGNVMVGISSQYGISGPGANFASIGMYTSKSQSNYTWNGTNNQNESTSKHMGINFQPRIGYFVLDNLALGIDANLSHMGNIDDDDYSYKSTSINAGPFARYYFPGRNVKPFVEASGSYGITTYKSEYGSHESSDKDNLMSFGGGVGLAFPLGEKASFDLMAKYNSYTNKDKDSEYNSKSTLNSITIGLGFSFYLGSK
jgi:outer membrane protein